MNKKLFVLAAMSTLILAGCKTGGDTPAVVDVAVSGISLNKEEIVLNVRGSETLVATVNPDNATNKEVTWLIEDENIATVDQTGKVTGVEFGETSLKVTSKADATKFALCRVIVGSKPKVELINALTNLGENVEADVSVKAGTPDWDGTEVPEARTYKLHTNKDYNYLEGVAGVVRMEYEELDVVKDGYYFAENVEDSFMMAWGSLYSNAEQYEAASYLASANDAIKKVASTEFIYSSKTGKYTIINKDIMGVIATVTQYEYVTDTEFSSAGIYLVGNDVKIDLCTDTKASEAVITYTFKAVSETKYAALDEFIAANDAPKAPFSAYELGRATVGTGIYSTEYDYTWCDVFSNDDIGGVKTNYTPNTKTEIWDNFDWAEQPWSEGLPGTIHYQAQMSDEGYTITAGIAEGSGLTPEAFKDVEFEEISAANYDWDLASQYYNVRIFEDRGYFNLFKETYSSGFGQAYSVRRGDSYTVIDEEGAEETLVIGQEDLEWIAQCFDIYSNVARFTDYELFFLPRTIDQIVIKPYFTENEAKEESLETLEGYRVYIRAIWDAVEWTLDDEGNIHEEVVYADIMEGFAVDYIDFVDFGIVDPFYGVGGLKDAGILREYFDEDFYIFPDDVVNGESFDFVAVTNLLDETNVTVSVVDETIGSITFDDETGLYTFTAVAEGTTKVVVKNGDEVIGEYEITVVPLLDLIGTFTFKLGEGEEEVTYTLILTNSEHVVDETGEYDVYYGTLNGEDIYFIREGGNSLYTFIGETTVLFLNFKSLTEVKATVIELGE